MGVEVKNLNFSYDDRQVLYDINFSVKKGEFLSILGPNGVGKSTLFRCILGLLPGYSGDIVVDGIDRKKLSVREAARHIAYIPQSSRPVFNFSVFDIVLMGRTSTISSLRSPSRDDIEKCHQALEKFGISQLETRCFHNLSGGERQLVLIARAVAQDSPVLMLDEPTANLDFGNQIRVLQQIKKLSREGYTIIQTTHNPEKSYMFSDRILALQGGRVLKDGIPGEVLSRENMSALYGIDVDVLSLYKDRARVCIPKEIIEE